MAEGHQLPEKGRHVLKGYPGIHQPGHQGDDTIDERLALFEKQRKNLEAQMAELQHTMDVLNFKCWYYETAKKAGTTLVPQCMEAEEIPEEFQKIREELHCKPECN